MGIIVTCKKPNLKIELLLLLLMMSVMVMLLVMPLKLRWWRLEARCGDGKGGEVMWMVWYGGERY